MPAIYGNLSISSAYSLHTVLHSLGVASLVPSYSPSSLREQSVNHTTFESLGTASLSTSRYLASFSMSCGAGESQNGCCHGGAAPESSHRNEAHQVRSNAVTMTLEVPTLLQAQGSLALQSRRLEGDEQGWPSHHSHGKPSTSIVGAEIDRTLFSLR